MELNVNFKLTKLQFSCKIRRSKRVSCLLEGK